MTLISKRAEEKHPVTGVASGFHDLDDFTNGFHPDQLIIVAARPSMGKTALMLNICDHAAINLRVPVLVVSLEMGNLEIGERLLCARSRVDGHKLRTGHGLDYRELNKLGRHIARWQAAPIFIDDTPARNMLQITAMARRLKLRQDLGLIVVDYIQLIDSEDSRDSRQEQIAKISRRLKTLARELHVPVDRASQLNRAVESREDRRPRMADLRESGAIEQDADMVLLLHRPEYYDHNDQPGIAEIIVAKNRNGPTGSVKLTFLKNLTRFENLSTIAEPLDRAGTRSDEHAGARDGPTGRRLAASVHLEGRYGPGLPGREPGRSGLVFHEDVRTKGQADLVGIGRAGLARADRASPRRHRRRGSSGTVQTGQMQRGSRRGPIPSRRATSWARSSRRKAAVARQPDPAARWWPASALKTPDRETSPVLTGSIGGTPAPPEKVDAGPFSTINTTIRAQQARRHPAW